MKRFHIQYQVLGAAPVGIDIEADSIESAAASVRRAGVKILSIKPEIDKITQVPKASKDFSLTLFLEEWFSLLSAGLTIPESLNALVDKQANSYSGTVIKKLYDAVQQGMRLSDALSQQADIFPELFIAGVRANEETGDIKESFSRYIEYCAQMDTVKGRLVAATIYPLVLMGIGFVILFFLMMYVIPRIGGILVDNGKDMPGLSSALLHSGMYLSEHAAVVMTSLISVVVSVGFIMSRPHAKRVVLSYLAMHTPYLKSYLALFRRARFLRTLSMLLDAGMTMPKALVMTESIVLSREREAVRELRSLIETGQSFSVSLEQVGLSDSITNSLLKIGERSGGLADLLLRAAEFHEQVFLRWIDSTSRLAEPLIMTVLGGMVGGVVLLMYIPIFDLADILQ